MNHDNSDSQQLPGGAIRIVHGAPPQNLPAPEQGPSTRVGGVVTRWNGSNLTAESASKHSSFQHSTAGVTGGSVVATLDRQGTALTVETIPGRPESRTSIASALRDGLLIRDSSGDLQDAPDVQQKVRDFGAPPEQPQQRQAGPGEGVFDARDDDDWGAAIEPLAQPAYDAAIASVIAVTAHGHGSLDDTARALAANARIDPELARRYVEEGTAMYQRVVGRSLAPMGLEGERLEAAYEYMRQQPQKLQHAIQELVHMRDPAAFTALATEFNVRHPDPRVLAPLQAAGFETMVDRETGRIMARIGQGNWHPATEILRRAAAAQSQAQR